jgi:cell division protein FtsB
MTAASAAGVRHAGATRTHRRARPTPRAALLLIVLLALLFAATVPLRTYLAQRAQLDLLEHQAQVLQYQNGLLDKQIERLHDPRYLERLARACLGMVRPGELQFAVTGKGVSGGGSSGSGPGGGSPADC